MLDKIIGSVLSNALGGASQGQNSSVISDVLGSLLKSQGGMEGIFNQLQKGGLGELLESWIGTGNNQPMGSEQVTEVFGEETISDVARQAGVDSSQAQDILSQVLPNLIDMLTPNGREGGVSTDVLSRAAQQAQQDNGFGLDDLIGGALGGLFGAEQEQNSASQNSTQGSINDLFDRILNTQTETGQTPEASNNSELAKDIGSVLNNFFK